MNLAHGICRCACAGAAILGLAAIVTIRSPARAAESYSEDAVKAAYLYRFAGYVNWPQNEAPEDGPFTIAVLGSPGVARELRQLLPGHLINNRPVQIREIAAAQDLGKPKILYVGTGYAASLRSHIPPAGLPALLLVTDEEGGLNAGSVLNFVTVDRRVRFEVSLTAADRSGLKVSADLLGVAIRVRGGGRQSRDVCSPFSLTDSSDGGCIVRVAARGWWRAPTHSRNSG